MIYDVLSAESNEVRCSSGKHMSYTDCATNASGQNIAHTHTHKHTKCFQ